jgi:hypothetical protein
VWTSRTAHPFPPSSPLIPASFMIFHSSLARAFRLFLLHQTLFGFSFGTCCDLFLAGPFREASAQSKPVTETRWMGLKILSNLLLCRCQSGRPSRGNVQLTRIIEVVLGLLLLIMFAPGFNDTPHNHCEIVNLLMLQPILPSISRQWKVLQAPCWVISRQKKRKREPTGECLLDINHFPGACLHKPATMAACVIETLSRRNRPCVF